MPEVIFLENKQSKKDYLKNVLDSIILKDVIARYDIRDVELIEKLLKFLANNVGSLTSILNVSNYLKNQFNKEYSTRTIANYLRYLRFPYIINEVSRYDLK
jgi:predicted AAA+ superfamily ATPase